MGLVEEDADMPVMDGDGLMAGEAPPLAGAAAAGMSMFIGPPRLRSWWTATHQFHTSACTAPATLICPELSGQRICG